METASRTATLPWNMRLPTGQAPGSCLHPRNAPVLYFQRPKFHLSLAQACVPNFSVVGALEV